MAADEPTDLILRFRDLVTEPGGTLRQHNAIVQVKGHVWWGWWSKGGEQVPFTCFAKLLAKLNAAGRELLLFDSGRNTIHRATCAEISWDLRGDSKPSPEKTCTPDYYRDQTYSAWFKLTAIDENTADPSVVRNWTYVRVDEFFKSAESKYGRFYGKRIFDLAELRQQDRTIWFVRPVRDEDPSHEIQLQDAQALTPEHFARSFVATPFRSLLWLSDLHFSKDGHHRFHRTAASSSLEVALENALKDHAIEVGGLLVSGDLTWTADQLEFDLARDSIRTLLRRLRLSAYQTAVCPGNHDLAFSATPAAKNTPVTDVGPKSRAGFETLYEALYYLKPNVEMASGRRFLLGAAIPIEIAALNSSALQQTKDLFQGHGFVGQPQLDAVAVGMGWDKPADVRPFRIAMLHHHLVPVSYRDEPVTGWTYSVVLDAGAILRWVVKHGIRLVIHGHMHQPFITRLLLPVDDTKPDAGWHELYVAGMGSTGVVETELGEVGKNTFGTLTFGRDDVTVRIFSVDPKNPSKPLWTVVVPYAQGPLAR